MLSHSSAKQHPSDHLANSKAASEKLSAIGIEEYKLHGIATDALFNGVCHLSYPLHMHHPAISTASCLHLLLMNSKVDAAAEHSKSFVSII